jgi:TusA-related sulfurtransferase
MKTREEMILDLIKYELEFLISNPEHMEDIAEWIVSNALSKLDVDELQELWNIKIN